MPQHHDRIGLLRTRWAAVGAAIAVSLGAGGIGIGIGHATISSGERAVFVPLDNPCRLASTRPAPDTIGPRTVGIGPDESYTLDGWGTEGNCALPSNTAGLALNVTAVNATQQTNLRFFPADAAVPTTANLNPSPGAPPTPNAVNVNLDSSGRFKVFNKFGVVQVVIDVMGYYEDHNHDDRYYTKPQVDSAVLLKEDYDPDGNLSVENAETAANADLLDGVHANELVRAAFDSTSNVIDANGNAVTATIRAPRPGILVMGGSIEAFGNTYDSWGCRLDVDGSIVSGSSMFSSTNFEGGTHTRNYNEDCSTDGAQVVAAGTHTVSLNIYLRDSVGLFEASVWAIYVPFDGNGAALAAPIDLPLDEPASDRRFEVDEAAAEGL